MLGMTIVDIEISAKTSGGLFHVKIPLKSGLNIIRAENSSGKSTCVNAIAYALGIEAVLGPSRKRPFPKSLYEMIFASKADQTQHYVTESSVSVSVENSRGIQALLKRDILGNDKKVDVLIQGGNQEYFLGAAGEVGSAKSERGFHYWLANFIGWELPNVVTFEGKELKLYLECIFPLFFIEQKRGWSEIQANSPAHYGIKNLKKAAMEFCLGIDSFEFERKVALLRNEIVVAENEWDQLKYAAESIADFSLVRVNKLSELSLNSVSEIKFSYLENDVFISVDAKERSLHRFLEELSSDIKKHTRSDEGLNSQLALIRNIRREVEKLGNSAEITLMSIDNSNDKISRLKHDYDQYLQLRRLKKVGADIGADIQTDKCPICANELYDSLGTRTAKRVPMSLDENIEFLKSQIDFFESIRNKNEDDLVRLRTEAKLVGASLAGEVDKLDRLKKDLDDVNGIANGIIREKALAEILLKDVVKLRNTQIELNEQASRIHRAWALATDTLKILRRNAEVGERGTIVRELEVIMKNNLTAFGFNPSAIADVTISRQTLRPEQQGYDIVAETSASDYIRIIWAYTLALLMLAGINKDVKHGGFVVFDEPRQHEASKVSFTSLITKAAESSGQVIFATSLEESELRAACEGKAVNLICFNDYILRPEVEPLTYGSELV